MYEATIDRTEKEWFDLNWENGFIRKCVCGLFVGEDYEDDEVCKHDRR